MKDITLKLKIWLYAEMTLLKLQAKRSSWVVIFICIALIFKLAALAMLNFAAYQQLALSFSPVYAALITCFIDVFVAIVFLLFAKSCTKPTKQEELVESLRDLAAKELDENIEDAKLEYEEVKSEILNLKSSIQNKTSILTDSIFPLLKLLLKSIRDKQNKE